jgi:iron(III) transport system substrate-binding protein
VLDERKAGVYSIDVSTAAPGAVLPVLKPAGALEPVRPLIIGRPEVVDDKYWLNGFEAGWMDSGKQFSNAYSYSLAGLVAINTDLVGDGEIKTVQDLLNPKWKGQILWGDPSGQGPMSALHSARLQYGDAIVEKLIVDQQAVFIRDTRQIAEALVRGRNPIAATAVTNAVLQEFKDAGLAKNIRLLDVPGFTYVFMSGGFMLSKAPHPNAAKLYVNWLLSKEAVAGYSQLINFNPRRLDVPPGDPSAVPQQGETYLNIGYEDNFGPLDQTKAMLDDLVKRL